VDAELIELGTRFYRDAGLDDVEILLNSIGDGTCRPGYVEALRAHFQPQADRLPPIERARLETNPLRLLDSKDPRMAELNATAPSILDHLCAACEAHFAAVRGHLDELEVAYRIDPRLVRGLDYYTRTTVEYYRQGESGQQQALGGGGRYDGLVELLGGRPTPGIGFALGLDRVMLALEQRSGERPSDGEPLAVVVGADPAATGIRLRIATTLRSEGLTARSDLSIRKLGRQLEAAARDGAHFAVIVGDELSDGDVQLRDLEAGTQRTVRLDDLVRELRRAAASHHHGGRDLA
ncbi:MAG: histidine--tRNA ligase, partial [Candidatus Limnocylindrales bacterium]